MSAEKDKGPSFSGTVLIWEASWLWHIIFRFPPIQNGRSRPTVWPDQNRNAFEPKPIVRWRHASVTVKLSKKWKKSDRLSKICIECGSRAVKWVCTVNIEQSRYIEQECSVFRTLSRLENGTTFSMCGKTNRFHFSVLKNLQKLEKMPKLNHFKCAAYIFFYPGNTQWYNTFVYHHWQIDDTPVYHKMNLDLMKVTLYVSLDFIMTLLEIHHQ